MARKMFVGNLEYKTTEEELANHFEQIGPVIDVFICLDKATGKSRGFGFVEMESEQDCHDALKKLNGERLRGRALNVQPSIKE